MTIDENWLEKARHKAAQIMFDYEHGSSDFSDGGEAEEIAKVERRAKLLPHAILAHINLTVSYEASRTPAAPVMGVGGWYAMDSAPADKTILVYVEQYADNGQDNSFCVTGYCEDDGRFIPHEGEGNYEPTYWRYPFPSPTQPIKGGL